LLRIPQGLAQQQVFQSGEVEKFHEHADDGGSADQWLVKEGGGDGEQGVLGETDQRDEGIDRAGKLL
jgi:hypothetical protein